MSVGLSSKFSILQQSPHDVAPPLPLELRQPGESHWLPSRYTVRAATDDGRLVLWNTLRGKMSVFNPEQRPAVEDLLRQRGTLGRKEGLIKYLADRGFLIKEGSREYREFQLDFGQQHYRNDTLQLILLASEDCNFRCTYCYEDFVRGTMQPSVRAGVKNLLARRLPTMKNLLISWFGGEPLYGWGAIAELAPHFLEVAEEHGLQYSSYMTTNAYLLTPEVADKLLAWRINSFQITLDGPEEFHDRSRPGRDGSGTFATILSNLMSLRDRPDRFAVSIRINFDRNNSPHLAPFLDRLQQEFGGDQRFRVMFRAVGRWGGSNDENLDVCGTDSSQVQLDLKAAAQRRGLRLADDLRSVQGFGSSVCYAARPYNFIIGASGKVMKCTIDLDKQDRNVVGHLTEEGHLELDRDKFALWTEPAFESDKKCQKCVVLPVCQGMHCPQVRFDTGHSPCTSLRKTYKHEMRELVTAVQTPRTVKVQHQEQQMAPVA
jgi:uncharacterized protein